MYYAKADIGFQPGHMSIGLQKLPGKKCEETP
jgi:hypothetical protein